MSCPICMRGNCAESFHSLEEQDRWADAILAYDEFLAHRRRILDEIEQESEDDAEAAE